MPPPPKIVDTRPPLAAGQHEIRGTVRRMTGNTLLVEKRNGDKVTIDDRKAIADYKFAVPSVGHALVARGAFAGGVLRAELIGHAPGPSDDVAAGPVIRNREFPGGTFRQRIPCQQGN